MNEKKVLLDAADIIADGWCQGVSVRNGARCVGNAIFIAAYRNSTDDPLSTENLHNSAARIFIRSLGLKGFSLIPNWNDAPERTQEDVILALKRAALVAGTRPSQTPSPATRHGERQ